MHSPVKKIKTEEDGIFGSPVQRFFQVVFIMSMCMLGVFLLPGNRIFYQSEPLQTIYQGDNLRKDIVLKEHIPERLNSTGGRQQGGHCDYTIGEWVLDSKNRPFYSGDACQAWLSRPWRCRLDKNRDISYEQYRWQPHGCDMPNFQGRNFLQRMANKTIAFVGDSIGRQQYQSLMCMITGTRDGDRLEVVDVSDSYGLVPAGYKPLGSAQKFLASNTTVLYYWSASLCEIGNITTVAGNITKGHFPLHLDRVDTFLQKNIQRLDVVVLNTGHHWNRWKFYGNKWKFYVENKPADKKLSMARARRMAVLNAGNWFNEQVKLRPELEVFVRSLSPRHFVGGEWNSGGRCDNIRHGDQVVKFQGDVDARDAVTRNERMKLLEISRLSSARGEAHIANFMKKTGQDCLHWCLPGIPDTWNEMLAAYLQESYL